MLDRETFRIWRGIFYGLVVGIAIWALFSALLIRALNIEQDYVPTEPNDPAYEHVE